MNIHDNYFPAEYACELSAWISIATRNLYSVTCERLRKEFTTHYEDAYSTLLGDGIPEEEAHCQALESLGNARKVNRRLKRTHLTFQDMICLENNLGKKPFYKDLKWILITGVWLGLLCLHGAVYNSGVWQSWICLLFTDVIAFTIMAIRFYGIRRYKNHDIYKTLRYHMITLHLLIYFVVPFGLCSTLFLSSKSPNIFTYIAALCSLLNVILIISWTISFLLKLTAKLKLKDNQDLFDSMKFKF